MAALNLLKSNETVNPQKIAAIGYCFGGSIVIQMAVNGVDLNGVVSFHGVLPGDLKVDPDKVKASILVCNGADDPFNPKENVEAFNQEMTNSHVDYEFKTYPGAKHSFTNPMADSLGQKFGLPMAYNKAADQQSWQDMKDFLNRIFAD
jgi:dienelactone hydrolase